MSKYLLFVFITVCSLSMVSCSTDRTSKIISTPNNSINSDDAVKLYSQLSGFKGIELYAWKDKETSQLLFGVLDGTNRAKTQKDFEILYKNPIGLVKAKEILKSYGSEIFVFVKSIGDKLSQDEVSLIKKEFDQLNLKNLAYLF